MTYDRADPTFRAPLPQDAEPPRDTPVSILNALGLKGVGDVQTAFAR